MAVEAAKRALASAHMDAEELDLIIAATITPDRLLPNLACEVQSALGARRAVAFDVSAACPFMDTYESALSPFTYGLEEE